MELSYLIICYVSPKRWFSEDKDKYKVNICSPDYCSYHLTLQINHHSDIMTKNAYFGDQLGVDNIFNKINIFAFTNIQLVT